MAGMNRTGGAEAEALQTAKTSRSPFCALARTQYAALARLRWHIFVHSLRSTSGILELGARSLGLLLFCLLGLVLGASMGMGAYAFAVKEKWPFLALLFWAVFILWNVVPVMLASFQEQFDLSSLLRFPVSFGSFFLLYLVFGLVDYSTIVGALCCLGIWAGVTAARPELYAWAALTLGLFATFNLFLVRAVFAWIDRWLAQRKTREIMGAVFLLLALGVQLLNPALHPKMHGSSATADQQAQPLRSSKLLLGPVLTSVYLALEWLPPGLAAEALDQASKSRTSPAQALPVHESLGALKSLGVLGLYLLIVGNMLASRLRAEYRGENLGAAPVRKMTAAKRLNPASMGAGSSLDNASWEKNRGQRESGWIWGGSSTIAAIMEKELRLLLRCLPHLYAIGVPLLMVVVLSGVFFKPGAGDHLFSLSVPLCVVYAQLGVTQLFSNNLGVEGAGIQLLFLSPTPIRSVLLAKNLLHALLYGVVALLGGILASWRLGIPDELTIAVTISWLLFALPCRLAAGNLLSLCLPFRVNPGRISQQQGRQANVWTSLLAQLAVLAVGAAVLWLCQSLARPWLAVPVFLLCAVAAALLWLRGLHNADAMANRRRDSLIAALMKTA